MEATFKHGIKVDTTAKTCRGCGRTMVTRRRYVELTGGPASSTYDPPGVGKPDGRLITRHGAHGYCTGCVDKHRPRPKKAAKPRKPRQVREAEYRREEWAFLKDAGVPIHEAAQRLGCSVATLEAYDAG